jgi:hypothetical protein
MTTASRRSASSSNVVARNLLPQFRSQGNAKAPPTSNANRDDNAASYTHTNSSAYACCAEGIKGN